MRRLECSRCHRPLCSVSVPTSLEAKDAIKRVTASALAQLALSAALTPEALDLFSRVFTIAYCDDCVGPYEAIEEMQSGKDRS